MQYRREIDGLRALAVVPVLLFHAGFRTFSGGFVGVDVFFVISGYLITSLILHEVQGGAFSLAHFYERRARRLLPALFVVVLFCLPLAWLWMTPEDLDAFSRSLIGVSTFSSNIVFWQDTGYFDTSSELKALLHTWSLAVEEQYYLFFPFVLLVMLRLGKVPTAVVIMLLLVASLSVAELLLSSTPAAVFYLLPTRGWELLTGALASFVYYSTSLKSIFLRIGCSVILGLIKQFFSLIGVVLIFASVFIYDAETPFPGFYALAPVIGAVLIILFSDNSTMIGRTLGHPFFVTIGLISYSLYLWHQPVLSLARHKSDGDLSKLTCAILLFLCFALAFVSWKYIERPFRDRKIISARAIAYSAVLFSLFFASVGALGHYNRGYEGRFELPVSLSASLKQEYDCNRVAYDGKSYCVVGDLTKRYAPEIAVLGDSHSTALMPAFDLIGRQLGKSIINIKLSGCPPLLETDVVRGGYHELGVCAQFTNRAFEQVKKLGIRKVVLIARWALYTDGDYQGKHLAYLGSMKAREISKEGTRRVFEERLHATIEAYKEAGVDAYIVSQVPDQDRDPKRLYYKLYDGHMDKKEKDVIRQASIRRERHERIQSYTRNLFEKYASMGAVHVIDLDEMFCDVEVCIIGNETQSYYRDHNHLSITGSLLAVSELGKQFHASLADGQRHDNAALAVSASSWNLEPDIGTGCDEEAVGTCKLAATRSITAPDHSRHPKP
jgi:peptidoglycan/LPS O-acetylase OafA/YrhL